MKGFKNFRQVRAECPASAATCHGHGQRRGAVLTEAVIVIPVLLLLLLGFIQFSSMYFTRHAMLQAAREGARALAVQDATIAQANAKTLEVLTMMVGQQTASQCQIASSETVVSGTKREGTVTIAIPAAAASIIGDPLGFMGGGNLTVGAVMRDEE